MTVVDDFSSGRPNRPEISGARIHSLDIASPDLVNIFSEARPDIVFHLAAQSSVMRSMRDPEADLHANLIGGINVLTQSARFNARHVVVFSTGGALYGEPESLPCTESHPIKPLSVYGASKHALEHYTRIFAREKGFSYTILRPGNVYGPGQDPHGEAGVIAIFVMQMLADDEVTIFGDGSQERDFIYVQDVVDAAVGCLDQDTPESGEFNIASGAPTSVNEIFSVIAGQVRYTKEPTYAPERRGEVRRIFLDIARARDQLGWEPRVRLHEGISKTVEAFRSGLAESSTAGQVGN